MQRLSTVFRSREELRRSLAGIALAMLLFSIAEPVGLPVFEPLVTAESAGAQTAQGQWVPAWRTSCASACSAQGMEAALSPSGDQCTSGENVLQSAVTSLGTGIFQSGCWPNHDCSQNVIPDGVRQTRSDGAFCYGTDQKRDSDPTDATAACFCAPVVQPVPECQDGQDNDGDGAIDGADFGCQNGQTESQSLAQCQDGKDNDNDGFADAQGAVVSGIPALGGDSYTVASGDPFQVRGFVNSRASIFGYGLVPDTNALHNDAATALQICRMAGYSRVQSVSCVAKSEYGSRCGYSSPSDNGMSRWTGSTFQSTFPATSSNEWIASLVCDQPQRVLPCQDGVDNDNDGLVDAQDPGCASADDTSELAFDPSCSNPQDNDESPADRPDLRIEKTPSSSSVVRGQPLTYTVSVVNVGTAMAQAVKIKDRLPTSLNFDPSLSPGCTQEGSDVVCDIGTLAPSQQAVRTIGFQTPAITGSCNATTVNNTASVVSANADANPGDNSATAQAVTLSCPPRQCQDGLDNDGDGAIDYPQDFSCSSLTDDDEANPKAQCQDGQDNDNDGAIDYPQDLGCDSPQDNTENSEPAPVVDLTIDGQNGPVTRTNGQTITLAWTSAGVARCTTASSTMPGWSGGEVVPTSGSRQLSATQSGQFRIECSKTPTSAPVAQDTVSLTVTASPQCRDGLDNDNDGAIDYPQDLGCASPDDNDEFNVLTADLSVTKQGPAEVLRGTTILYTLTATNAGPGTANHVAIQDTIPQGFTFVPSVSSPNCVILQGKVVCDNLTLATGQSATVTVAFAVPATATCGSSIIDTGSVSSAITDPNSSNNEQSLSTRILCPAQCQDGKDNDGDGLSDMADPGCSSPQDDDERNAQGPACDNGIDDDGDGAIDYPQDPGCQNPLDDDERTYACSDGIDNDHDGATDFPADFGCDTPTDSDESSPKAQCQDGQDNDGDGVADALDAGCHAGDNLQQPYNPQDNDERNQLLADLGITMTAPSSVTRGQQLAYRVTVTNKGPDLASNIHVNSQIPAGLLFDPAHSYEGCILDGGASIICNHFSLPQNGVKSFDIAFRVPDNAACGGTLINIGSVQSLAADPVGTDNVTAPVQTSIRCPQCSDDQDNDGDGAIDYPNDVSCSNSADDDETNPRSACQDGQDNDGDGLADALDPGCHIGDDLQQPYNSQDMDERNAPPITLSSVNVNGCNVTVQYAKSTATCAHLLSTTGLMPLHDANLFCKASDTAHLTLSDFRAPFAPGLSVSLCDGNNYQHCSTPVTVTGGGTCTPLAQCQDGIDNDGDLATDYPNDVSCSSPTDNDEANPKPQCQDGIDNDHDGATDMGDPGCLSQQDNDESNLAEADISVVKSAVSSIERGKVLLYTITATNHGPDTASNVVIQDVVPQYLTFNPTYSSPACTQIGTSVVCNMLTLGRNASSTVSLAFTVSPTTPCDTHITNIASVASSATDRQPSNNESAPVDTLVTCPQATFSLQKTDNRDTATQGESIIYTISAHNTSQTLASTATLTDTLPPGLTFVNASDAGLVNGTTVTWMLYNVAPGATVVRTLTARVAETTPIGTALINVAAIGAVQAQDTTTVAVKPQCSDLIDNDGDGLVDYPQDPGCMSALDMSEDPYNAAIFAVDKTADRASVQPGDILTYTVRVQNVGNLSKANVTLVDAVAPHLAFQTTGSTQGCAASQSTIVCTPRTYAPGDTMTYTLKFRVQQPTPNQCNQAFDNTAILRVQSDIVGSSNTVSTQMNCPVTDADLALDVAGPGSVVRGEQVTYILTLQNLGPATATNVVVRNPVPLGTQFFAASDASCQVQGSIVTCAIGSLSTGAPRTFALTFTVPSTTPCDAGTVAESASVTSDADPVSSNNSDQSPTQITCPTPLTADRSVTTYGDATVTRGDIARATIQVINNGPATSATTTLTDTPSLGFTLVPAESTFGAGISCTQLAAGAPVSCMMPSLAPQATRTIVLAYRTPTLTSCTADETVSRTAALAAASEDPVTSNDTASASIMLRCPALTSANLSLQKTGPQSVIAGQPVTFTMIAFNAGPNAAENVVITDPLPQGTTFVSASGAACTNESAGVRCTLGTLLSGQSSQPVTVTLMTAASQQGTCTAGSSIKNIATIASSTPDPLLSNNTASATASLTCSTIDLSVTKTGPARITAGQTVTYVLTAANAGPGTATNVSIVDVFPADLQFASVQGAQCSLIQPVGQTTTQPVLSCQVGTIAPGASAAPVTVTFSTVAPTGACTVRSVTNTAQISSADASFHDTQSANDTASVITTLDCPTATTADLAVTTTGPSSVVQGQNIVYTLTASNAGPASVTNAQVTHTLPQGLSSVGAVFDPAITGAACTVVGQVVTCVTPTLASGASATIRLTAKAKDPVSTCSAETVTNTTTIAQQNPAIVDPNTSNNTATLPTTLACPTATSADLTVTKSASATSVTRGNTVSYTLAVTNSGPAAVSQVKVVDTLLAGSSHLTYQSSAFSSGTTGTCSSTSSAVECTFGTAIAAGQTVSVTLTFLAPTVSSCSDTQTVTDKATVSENDAAVTETNTTNNESATLSTSVLCASTSGTIDSLTITKSHSPATPIVGQYVLYSIALTNTSTTATLSNITVSDPLPSGLTFLSATDNGSLNGSTVTWSGLTLSPGANRTLYLQATVTGTQSMTNTVTATIGGGSKSASDTFTPQQQYTSQPPIYPPYYPTVPQAPYYPPVTPTTPYYPPVSYPTTSYTQPTTPIVYQQPVQSAYVMPATGAPGDLFAAVQESGTLTPVDATGAQETLPAVLYATIIALLAAGSAAGAKMIGLLGF